MRKTIIVLFSLFLLEGCLVPMNIPVKTQEAWRGRSIADLQQKMGSEGWVKYDENGQKYYLWTASGTFRNVGPYASGLSYASCEFRAYIDEQNKITKFVRVNKGLNCTEFIYRFDK